MFILRKFSKLQKINCLLFSILFVMMLSIGIPSLARYKNRVIIDIEEWNGSVATSYSKGDGTKDNPYIISNGSELAFLSESLVNENYYEGKYFILSNNIVLNRGAFSYSDDNLMYKVDENLYYIKDNNYYSDTNYDEVIDELNILNSLNGFKGYFNGNSYTIYGLYMNSDSSALFTNLEGSVTDLYVENALILGDSKSGGIVTNASNSVISNVLFNGYVINRGSTTTENSEITIDDITVNNVENNTSIELPIEIPFGSKNVSVKLIGDYVVDEESNATIKINDNLLVDNHFEIVLNNPYDLTITTISDTETTLSFSNVVLQISYEQGIAGGILATATNSEIKNVINKGYVYSNSIAAGIVGILDNSNISNSYNNGNIDASYNGAIISIGNGNITLEKVYNSNENNGLIYSLNNGVVNINNSFNVSSLNVINEVNNVEISVDNSYVVNSTYDITSKFKTIEIEELKDKTNLESIYKEFISFENLETEPENIWVYNDDSYPVLYIDDINNPVAKLHVNTYTYNNFSPELDVIKFTNNITFSVEDIDLNETTKYYYISKEKTPLTKTQLEDVEWLLYDQIVTIEEEGIYVVYVKTVDNNENTFYLNSDLLILDLSGSTVNIKLNDLTWNTTIDNPQYKYINQNNSIIIEANDEISGIKSIEYYVAKEITNLEDIVWLEYKEDIVINEQGKYIIYTKVIDNCDYVTYANTDYIIYGGYTETMSVGRNGENLSSVNITDNSIIKFNFIYESDIKIEGNHKIVSNTVLPVGTIMTLYDYNKDKFYEYKITTNDDFGYSNNCDENNCYATYDFTLFKEKGNTNEILYVEDSSKLIEKFDITLDFKNISIVQNLNNLQIKLEKDTNNSTISTLKNTLTNYNLYVNSDSTLDLKATYIDSIIYNSDSVYEVNLTSGINYKYIDEQIILDTVNQDKIQGLTLTLVDSNNNVLDENYLKNLIFSIDDVEYYPGIDNIVRIPLSDSLEQITKTLKIKTHTNAFVLSEGTYYLKIQNFISYDGLYSDIYQNAVNVPVVIKNGDHVLTDYEFNVSFVEDNNIIYKQNGDIEVGFKITRNGEFVNPNIRLSLYKKDELTAYNQDYSIINLSDFTTDELTAYSDNTYYVPIDLDVFNLNLIVNNFENTGYRLIFELYDGDKKIGSIIKNFIVR